MTALDDFLGKNSEESTIRKVFPDFDSLEPDAKVRLRNLWSNRNKQWANYALHTEFGLECNNKWCGICGFHSGAEIAAERAAANER